MRINKVLILAILLAGIFAITVASQIQGDTVSAEEKQDCTVTFYNQTQNIYGYVTRTRDTYGTCYNSANESYYSCVNGTESYQNYEVVDTQAVLKNNTKCQTSSYVITITKGLSTEKKEVDFSSWGTCVKSTENDCIAITCGTLKGGSARNGIFNGCDNGKSCQKFLFCPDSTQVLYKAARGDFVQEDPTFQLDKLSYKEVGQ
ncbi:hypothetical protein HY636_05090 [Candidatus Woesearchaeota archaeon]|nr:hypothetical protein [Candidatus Woesearchaeota archaeon]